MEVLSNVTLGEVVGWGLAITGVLCTILERTPEVISPWTKLFNFIGKALNGEVLTRLEALEKKVETLQLEEEERNVINCRNRIVRFGDELLHNINHSKDHFDQILIDIDTYESYCDHHTDFRNNITELTIQHIKEIYQECLNKHTFL